MWSRRFWRLRPLCVACSAGEPEGGLGDLGGEDGVFPLFLHAALLPLVGQLVPDGDAAQPPLDPRLRIALGPVKGTGALGGQFGILDLLHPLIAHPGQPALERLGLGAGDGLDQAEDALGVGTVQFLWTAGRLDQKGVDNLSIPFGQLWITATDFVEVIGRVDRVSQRGHDVDDDKPPLVLVDGLADFLFLKQGDAGFHGERRFHERPAAR